MARRAMAGLSAGISTSRTSALAACTRRATGSDAETGKLEQVVNRRPQLGAHTQDSTTAPAGSLPRTLAPIELPVVQERLRVFGPGRSFRIGRDPVYGAQHHQFRIALLRVLALEEIAQDRNIPKAGNLVPNIGDA